MERVRELRRRLGLYQKDFAEKCGFYQQEISRIESEQTTELTPRQILAISRAFSVSVEWLTTGKGEIFQTLPQPAPPSPFDFAISQGFGSTTARALALLCELSSDKKEQLEKTLSASLLNNLERLVFNKEDV